MTTQTAWHPWSFIEEERKERLWTKDELARRMGGNFDVMRLSLDLLEASASCDDMDLSAENWKPLAQAFGVSPEFFENLYRQWVNAGRPLPEQDRSEE